MSHSNAELLAVEDTVKSRRHSEGTEPVVFADIYQEDVNIVTWQRELSKSLQHSVGELLVAHPSFKSMLTVTPQNASALLGNEFGLADQSELVDNITELVDIFCCLFEIPQVGLRLTALDRAMCPKFHVDRVPCRLVTTFQGVATQWLPHSSVDRTKLGVGSNGLPDSESGLYENPDDIQQLNCGDIALLKGESWYGNENAGLVHRSPVPLAGENRLLLTLDFVG